MYAPVNFVICIRPSGGFALFVGNEEIVTFLIPAFIFIASVLRQSLYLQINEQLQLPFAEALAAEGGK